MKKMSKKAPLWLVCIGLAMLTSTTSMAQLPDGSIAPDFTATDINGVEHNLYSYLDSGYQVILNSPHGAAPAGATTQLAFSKN